MTGAVAKQSSPGRDALSEAGQGVSGSSGGPQERRGAQAGEPGTGSARRAAGAAEVHEWRSEAGTGTRAGGGDSPVATPRSGTASAGEGSVKRDGGRPAGPPNDSQNSPGAGVRASVWRARSPGTSSAALGDAVLTVEGKECEASSPWGSPARERPVPDAPDTGIPPIPSLICLLPGPEDRSLPVVLSHLPPGAKPFVASSRLKSRGRGRLRIREKRARQRARDLDAAHEHSSSSFFTIQSGADVSGRVTQAGTPTPGAEVSEAFRATRAVGFSSGEADAAGAAFQLPAGGPELRRMHSVAFSSKRLLLEVRLGWPS